MSTSRLTTACHAWHTAHGGRMVDFAGWDMPVQYSTIVAEHNAVRQAAGLFDIAHMGRLKFSGPDAVRFLDHLLTNDVAGLIPGQVRYALVCNAAGGILDDVLVYRLVDQYLLVVNASNRVKILSWIEQQRSGFDVEVIDQTHDSFMAAFQGPLAESLLQPLVNVALSGIAYYHFAPAVVLGTLSLVSRTGYTGEDGFELIVPAALATQLWEALLQAGASQGVLPAGLGCRDTLRLEAAMPLYGHELNEELDPFTAGLGFAVKLEKGEFLGRSALAESKANKYKPRRVGLELAAKRIAREGAAVLLGDTPVGQVTSGTFSPTLQKAIAMAYVEPTCAALGTSVEIDVRGQREMAQVVKLPFYRRD